MYRQQGRYNSSFRGRPPFRGGNFGGRGRRIKSLPNDPKLFIKRSLTKGEAEEYIAKNTFETFNLHKTLMSNIEYKKYQCLTPVQDQAIPEILNGKDLIGLAATGTGKTAAFLIPLIQLMHTDKSKRTLVITPTRELAVQIQQEFKDFAFDMQLFSTLLIGGAHLGRQISELRRDPHIVIATPGRLKDLTMRNAVNLSKFTNVVLDEVDLMVDIGFINDIKFFTSLLPQNRQSLFFSATISPKIQDILHSFVKDPVTISVKKQETSENVDQDVIRYDHIGNKIEKLHDLLINKNFEKVLVFGRTKHGVERLSIELQDRGFKVGAIHGNKSQGHRQNVIRKFKSNEIRILLATDVASRGLDIPDVTHVINYELPENFEDYIHRIGRTGRANKKGVALTFIQNTNRY